MGEAERSKRGPQVMYSQLEFARGWQRFPGPQHSSWGVDLGSQGFTVSDDYLGSGQLWTHERQGGTRGHLLLCHLVSSKVLSIVPH